MYHCKEGKVSLLKIVHKSKIGGFSKLDKVYKVIRIITVAPVLALVMVIIVAGNCKGVFPSPWHLVYSVFFLGVLPLLAYPLQRYIPAYKDKGREGQRNLAILFAASGFTMGCIISFIIPAPIGLRVIFLEYFCGAFAVLIFNKGFHIRLSGHACGAVAPMALYLYFGLYIAAAVGMALAVLVFVASIETKRHTCVQLIGGGLVPLVSIVIIGLLF